MFEGFPYTNFHELNLDWIIKIAKDFLDQYTHIQEVIETGEQSLIDKTDAGLTQLQEKADALDAALQNLYNDYSAQMASQLADALQDLNTWYTTHQNYLDTTLANNITAFESAAATYGASVIASIPTEYGDVTNSIKAIPKGTEYTSPLSPWNYFYGYGYFDASFNFVENAGILTLKIPIHEAEFVIVKCKQEFMAQINSNYRFTYELEDGTKTRSYPSGYQWVMSCTSTNVNDFEAVALGFSNTKFVYMAIYPDGLDIMEVIKDKSLYFARNAVEYPTGIYNLKTNKTAYGTAFFDQNHISLVTGSNVLWKRLNAGDVLQLTLAGGFNYYGSFKPSGNDAGYRINNSQFTAPSDGYACIFVNSVNENNIVYIPAQRFKLYSSDIIGNNAENEYNGLNAVAFGTSLTYRSQTTGGYLNYLPSLSGMTIDNQGISSGKMRDDILSAIQAYTGYANKRVAIIEGFVNDFGYNAATLGTYTDGTTATVCGCLRTAINYIMAQNANITIFVVLDHYGKNSGGVDTSSTALNAANQTQFQYYNELAKVAESLGIPVIPLYKISGISENTPQYLADNIHPTALGALQTASAIWECMKTYYPNKVSS